MSMIVQESIEDTKREKMGIPRVVTSYIRENVPSNSISLNAFMKNMEREIIEKALKVCNGNKKNTAQLLGLKYSTLSEKIKAMNIRVQKRKFFDNLYLDQ